MSHKDPEEDSNSTPNVSESTLHSSPQKTDAAVPDAQPQVVDQGASLAPPAEPPLTNEKKVTLCSVCNEKPSKYKCTQCYTPYCSILCSVAHKRTHPPKAPTPPKPEPVETVQKDTTIPRVGTAAAAGYKGVFVALDDSAKLQTLFKLYPTLPSILLEIYTATLRPTDEDDLNGQPYHRGGKGQHRNGQQKWNPDRGDEYGIAALRQAKKLKGKDGEGVREYSQLVLQTLASDDTVDAAALIRKELAEEDARIVEFLLNGER